MAEIEQPLARVDDRVIDLRKLRPAEIEQIRAAGPSCPVCRAPGQIVIGDQGPLLYHQGEHEPEDLHRRMTKRALRDHLRGIIFPHSQVAPDVYLPQGIADLAVVRENGARIAIKLISGPVSGAEIREWNQALRAERIRPMWLLDARRLPPAAARGLEAEVRSVSYRASEIELLALGEPLVYYQTERRLIHWIEVPEELGVLARAGEVGFGRVSSLIRRYRLSALRVRQGQWWVDRTYDENLPIPRPPVPKRIVDKLAKLNRGNKTAEP